MLILTPGKPVWITRDAAPRWERSVNVWTTAGEGPEPTFAGGLWEWRRGGALIIDAAAFERMTGLALAAGESRLATIAAGEASATA